jgi:hypothetical protein
MRRGAIEAGVRLAEARERLDQIEDEPFDTPEEEAELSRRLNIADEECLRKQVEVDEAEEDLRLALVNLHDYDSDADQDDDFDDDGHPDERLSVHDAADVWRSSGMDEDRMFGYTAEELERAAEEE